MAVTGDLVTNVVASFVFEGIKRCYGAARTTIRRRQAINRALDGNYDIKNKTAESAISDLEMVIGSDRGELTEPVAKFLKELEASAIPDTIVRAALSGEDTDNLFPAFNLLFRSFTPCLNFDSQAFFTALVTAIRQRVEAQVSDPGLLEFLQAQNKALSSQLTSIIRTLQLAGESKDDIPYDFLHEARLKMARAIENTNRFLSVETLQGVKRCNIRSLVVPARLQLPVRDAAAMTTGETEISYLNFRSYFNRAVIVGDPGGGKSTLTQLLCYDLACAIGVDASHPGRKEIGPLKIPLRIILRSYDKRRRQNPAYGIIDYLIDENATSLDSDKVATHRVLTRLLSLGSVVLIFDGLDEILDVEPRREIVTFIEQFGDVYAACPVLVTSRFVGYQDAPMSEDFAIFTLTRFDTSEIETFAQRLVKQVGRLKLSEAKTKASQFIRQTDSVGHDLRENPLMLGLMVYIFMYRGDVPSNRPEIYKECATLMFERWDQRRDIFVEIPTDFELLDVFAYLANEIFGSAETEDGVSREWLTDALRRFFEQWYLEKPKAVKVEKSLVTFITGRAWVMCEIGPKIFKFTHRTFLEYFFARYLISTSESVADLIKSKLLDKVIRSQWDVIVHLALHAVVFRDVGKMNQAADTLLGILRSVTLPPQQELAYISFVAKTLEYLVLPEPKYQEMVTSVVTTAIHLGGHVSVAAADVIDTVVLVTQKRQAVVKPVVHRLLKDQLKGAFSAMRSFAAYVCSGRHGSFPVVHSRMLRRGHYIRLWKPSFASEATSISSYFSPINAMMKSLNYERAIKDVYEARLYMFVYGDRRFELVKRHGIGALVGDGPHLVFAYINDLLLDIIEEVIEAQLNESSIMVDRLQDNLKIIDIVIDNSTNRIPRVVSSMETRETLPERIDWTVRNVYAAVLGESKRRRRPFDWGRVVLALAVYLDICCLKQRRVRRDRPAARQGDGRLSEFMPRDPMKLLLRGLETSSVFKQIESWNDGEVTFSE